jgi:hypothetical protein
MDSKAMANFIVVNADLLENYDLKETYLKAMRNRIRADYGIYANENLLNYNLSYEENLKKFLDNVICPKYKDIDTYKFYQSFQFIGRNTYSIDTEKDTVKIQGSKLYVSYIVYLLFYVVKNEVHKDMGKAMDMIKEINISDDTSNFSFTNFNLFGDVQVRKLNSGKIIFKGLTPEMKERLYKFYDITHR